MAIERGTFYQPGTILRFRPTSNANRKYTVRVTSKNQQRYPSPGGRVYVSFVGVRVRPADHNVSFGHNHAYVVREDAVEVVKACESCGC
jgi:hypothetical protein